MARVLELLTLIRIGAMPPPDSNDAERAAIADIAEALVAEDLERQRAAAHGFFRTEGEHAGVPREHSAPALLPHSLTRYRRAPAGDRAHAAAPGGCD
jgi:hypothetical protein